MNGLNLHHVGFAVKKIDDARSRYVDLYGYEICSDVIHDPLQTAFVQFLRLPGDSSYLELVAPDGPGSKLTASVAKGGALHHLCYATDDIDKSFAELRAQEMFPLCEPVAAVAFPGRRIAWLLGSDRLPIELVERGRPGEL